eukprot:scaffold114548_cov18-Tisochrysis_lutea.AAC.1
MELNNCFRPEENSVPRRASSSLECRLVKRNLDDPCGFRLLYQMEDLVTRQNSWTLACVSRRYSLLSHHASFPREDNICTGVIYGE